MSYPKWKNYLFISFILSCLIQKSLLKFYFCMFLYVLFYFLQVLAYPGMFVGMFEAGGWKSRWLGYVQAWFLITSTTRLLRAIYLCMADPNLSQHVCSSSFTNGIVYPFTPESSKRWGISIFILLVRDGRKGQLFLRCHFFPAALKSFCSWQQWQLLLLEMLSSSLCGTSCA